MTSAQRPPVRVSPHLQSLSSPTSKEEPASLCQKERWSKMESYPDAVLVTGSKLFSLWGVLRY